MAPAVAVRYVLELARAERGTLGATEWLPQEGSQLLGDHKLNRLKFPRGQRPQDRIHAHSCPLGPQLC
jgi:hypothetical protein